MDLFGHKVYLVVILNTLKNSQLIPITNHHIFQFLVESLTRLHMANTRLSISRLLNHLGPSTAAELSSLPPNPRTPEACASQIEQRLHTIGMAIVVLLFHQRDIHELPLCAPTWAGQQSLLPFDEFSAGATSRAMAWLCSNLSKTRSTFLSISHTFFF